MGSISPTTRPVPNTTLPDGEPIPVLGQGTWHMAEHPARRRAEIQALRVGLDLGLTLIDTAEMYADGEAEVLAGEAIAGRRDEVFLVSKVLPQHASRRGVVAACEASLRRLRTERLDLYLLHWRGKVPLAETLEGFFSLMDAGMIRHWGVSNFDASDLDDLEQLPRGNQVATDQVLYNLTRRGIEWDLLPWCQSRRIPIMAYSPIEQGRMLRNPTLREVSRPASGDPRPDRPGVAPSAYPAGGDSQGGNAGACAGEQRSAEGPADRSGSGRAGPRLSTAGRTPAAGEFVSASARPSRRRSAVPPAG